MTLATQTWRVAGPYTLRVNSLINRLTDIKDAFVANNADSNGLWQEDTFTLTGTELFLKIKRKGSPSGSLGTFRGILFGTSVSSGFAAASINIVTVSRYGNTAEYVLFMGAGENIDTTAPTMTNVALNLMFNVATTKFSGGFTFDGKMSMSAAGNIGSGTTMYIVECDRMCAIVILGASTMSWGVFGECIERIDNNTGLWACYGSNNIQVGTSFTQTARASTTVAQQSALPIFSTAQLGVTSTGEEHRSCGAYHNAGVYNEVSRIWCAMTHGVDTPILEGGGSALLPPIILGRKANVSEATTDYGLLGLARQIRMGPLAIGGVKRVFNGTPTLRGYIAVPNTGAATQGIVFDNSP